MRRYHFQTLAVLATASALASQGQFLTLPDGRFGTRLSADATSVVTLPLGFPFTMPGGAVVTEVDVHATGRILEVGADPSDNTETVSEFLNDDAVIAVRWDQNNFPLPASDLYVAADASVVAITWAEVQFGSGQPANAQVQLFADGRILFVYDSRIANDDGLVGVSAGHGVLDPGPTDYSALVGAPMLTTDEAVYEDFGFQFGIDDLDLQGKSIEFVPNGPGGANGWAVVVRDDVVDVNPFAEVVDNGGGCFRPFTTTFVPAGRGQYDVVSGASQFDPDIGARFGAEDDDMITAIGVDLGFPFTFPGGMVEQFVRVDPNGRILPDSATTAMGLFIPNVGFFESAGYPMICSWTDFNVQAPGSDGIYLRTGPGFARFTWNDVAQFDADFQPLTQQITLRSDGSVTITIQDFRYFNSQVTGDDNLLIGLSDGVSSGAAELDLMSATVVRTSLAAYEFWAAETGVEPVDFLIDQPVLISSSPPAFGGTWRLGLFQAPQTATSAFVFLGLAPIDTRLDAVGIPCSLNLLPVGGGFPLVLQGPGSFAEFALPISTDPVLRGFSIYAQGVVDAAPFAPFPFFFTNSLEARVGD